MVHTMYNIKDGSGLIRVWSFFVHLFVSFHNSVTFYFSLLLNFRFHLLENKSFEVRAGEKLFVQLYIQKISVKEGLIVV